MVSLLKVLEEGVRLQASGRGYFNFSDFVKWLGHGNAAFTQGFQMGPDGFADQSLDFLPAPADCYAPR